MYRSSGITREMNFCSEAGVMSFNTLAWSLNW